MLATYLSAVLALLLLWNVYPKDFDYGAAAGNGLLFYNANVGFLLSCPSQSRIECSADITVCNVRAGLGRNLRGVASHLCLQAVGKLPANNPISWRGDALLYEKAPKLGFDDLTGGWLQGGVAGESWTSAALPRQTADGFHCDANSFQVAIHTDGSCVGQVLTFASWTIVCQ